MPASLAIRPDGDYALLYLSQRRVGSYKLVTRETMVLWGNQGAARQEP